MSGSGPRVALIGIHGHGRVHLGRILAREQAGRLRLAGLADRVAPTAPEAAVLQDRPFDTDAARLLGDIRPDIAVIATPIHTHARIAARALRLGAHVLLEKPPVTSVAEHNDLVAAAAAARRHCQVGFQAAGSSLLPELIGRIRGGQFGTLTHLSVVGAWYRAADYYTRSAWAGRRSLGSTIVADGAMTNPFAHGIDLALRLSAAVAPAAIRSVQIDPYHAYPIETDDTAAARIELDEGPPITVAVTLCSELESEPYVEVHGTKGRATLYYTQDRLALNDFRAVTEITGERTDLLDDLIAHLDADPSDAALLSPLSSTRLFTEVLEAVQHGPVARPIAERYLSVTSCGRTVPGIEEAVAEAGVTGRLFSEMDLPWTR
jgi:predicted dehydrogenase